MQTARSNINAGVIDSYSPQCCPMPRVLADSHGILVCAACGTVLGPILVEYERKAYDAKEKRDRVHHEVVNGHLAYRTTFTAKNAHYRRLRVINNEWHSRSRPGLKRAWIILKRLEDIMGVSRYIFDIALRIETTLMKNRELKGELQGHSISTFCVAAIYLACHVAGSPMNVDAMIIVADSMGLGNVTRHGLVHCIVLLKQHVIPALRLTCGSYSDSVKNYILSVGTRLGIDIKDQRRAIKIYYKACKCGLNVQGISPAGIAAACLYLATIGYSQRYIAAAFHITEVTLRNRAKDIMQILNIDREGCRNDNAASGNE